jgi:general secretion pathway protein A
MYCEFYGFSQKPFESKLDRKFIYTSPGYSKQLAALVSGIQQGLGLIVLLGRKGVGKATLIDGAASVIGDHLKMACISQTDGTFEGILIRAILELGIMNADEMFSQSAAIDRLANLATQEKEKNASVVLVITEAHELETGVLESLPQLWDPDPENRKWLQIVLSGQPQLLDKLKQPQLHALTGGKIAGLLLEPLGKRETSEYIQRRLKVAGHKGGAIFDSDAQHLIWEYSGGVPLKINAVCETALKIGFDRHQKQIDARVTGAAVEELDWTRFIDSFEKITATDTTEKPHRRFPRAAGLFLLVCVFLAAGYLFMQGKLGGRGDPLLFEERAGQNDPSAISTMDAPPGRAAEAPTERDESIEQASVLSKEKDPQGEKPRVALKEQAKDEALGPKVSQGGGGPETEAVKQAAPVKAASDAEPQERKRFVLQLGAYRKKAGAERLVSRLNAKGYDAYIEEKQIRGKGRFHRLRIRCCEEKSQIRTVTDRLKNEGFGEAIFVGQAEN